MQLQMKLVDEDRKATIALNEGLGQPSTAVWDRVFAAVSAKPAPAPLRTRLARGLNFLNGGTALRFALAAAALAVVIEGAALMNLLPWARTAPSDSFVTASAPPEAMTGSTALVVFAPGTRIEAINGLLVEIKAAVVDGPHSGFYKIRRFRPAVDKSALDAAMQRLRTDPAVKVALQAPD